MGELSATEHKMLSELLGKQMYAEFVEEYKEQTDGQSNNCLLVGDDFSKSLIDERVLSKRLKSKKTRGTVEELNDYDEIMSDDEDERNMNNYDVMDDGEEDIWSDDEAEDESEQNEIFQKMEKNLKDNLTEKEYEVPVPKNNANGLFDGEDSADEDGEDGKIWNISGDEDDEDEDAEDDNFK